MCSDSGAGKAEFFRQWLLISRSRQWEPDQPHELWLSIGGSAGHASLIALSIDERIDEATGERGYRLTVESGRQARDSMSERRATAKEKKREEGKLATIAAHCEKIRDAFVGQKNLTKSKIEELSGISAKYLSTAIADMLRRRELESDEQKIQGMLRTVYSRIYSDST